MRYEVRHCGLSLKSFSYCRDHEVVVLRSGSFLFVFGFKPSGNSFQALSRVCTLLHFDQIYLFIILYFSILRSNASCLLLKIARRGSQRVTGCRYIRSVWRNIDFRGSDNTRIVAYLSNFNSLKNWNSSAWGCWIICFNLFSFIMFSESHFYSCEWVTVLQ